MHRLIHCFRTSEHSTACAGRVATETKRSVTSLLIWTTQVAFMRFGSRRMPSRIPKPDRSISIDRVRPEINRGSARGRDLRIQEGNTAFWYAACLGDSMRAATLAILALIFASPTIANESKCASTYQTCMNHCADSKDVSRCFQLCSVEQRVCAGGMLPRAPSFTTSSFDAQYQTMPSAPPVRRRTD